MALKQTSGTTVPPSVISGFQRMRVPIIAGLIGLTGLYMGLVYALRDSSSYLTPATEYCPDPLEPCSRPDLFAFQIGSSIMISYVGLVGFWAWYISKAPFKNVPSTPEGRLFGYIPEAEKLAACNFTFQIWDFAVSLFIAEHCTALMLTHHVLAALVSGLSLHHQYLHYYGVFFLGLTECSSIFLVYVDLARFFPPESGTWFDIVVAVSGPLFAITFFFYRVVLWWKISYMLWSDALYVLRNGISEQFRPGKSYVLYIFLIANVPLGFLQLYWLKLIGDEAVKVLAPA